MSKDAVFTVKVESDLRAACQIASNRDPSFACNADPSVVRASAFFVIGRGLST